MNLFLTMYFTLSETAEQNTECSLHSSTSPLLTDAGECQLSSPFFHPSPGRPLGPSGSAVKQFPVRGLRSRRSKGGRVKESWDVQICDDGRGDPFFVVKYRDQRRTRHDMPLDKYSASKNGEVMSALHDDLEEIQRDRHMSGEETEVKGRSVKVKLRPGVGLNVALFQRVLCRYGNPESFVSSDLDSFTVTYQSPEQATSALMNFSLDLHHYIEKVELICSPPPPSHFSLFSFPSSPLRFLTQNDELIRQEGNFQGAKAFPRLAGGEGVEDMRMCCDLETRLCALVDDLCG